jgi:hypothetical protein
LVPLEEEVDLVAIKFQGAQVGLTVSGDGFSTEVAMAALTIDDLLVGSRNPDKAHMARSSIVWEQQVQTPQQQQPLGSSQQQQQQQGVVAAAAGAPPPPAAAAGAVGAGGGPAAAQPLVVDTGQEEDVGIAFRTITDEGEAAEGDDDEFYDADEGACVCVCAGCGVSGCGLQHSLLAVVVGIQGVFVLLAAQQSRTWRRPFSACTVCRHSL